MNFYLQQFEDYYLLPDWESQLQRYESQTKAYNKSCKTIPE